MFEFPEDQKFFEELLCNADCDLLPYKSLFDFRSPTIKRAEFNRQMAKIRARLIERYGKICMLRYSKDCDIEKGVDVDHLIPLSSNKLNKELRKLAALTGKKVKTQSFGSNDLLNMVLACKKCNSHKKHRFLTRSEIKRILDLKGRSR